MAFFQVLIERGQRIFNGTDAHLAYAVIVQIMFEKRTERLQGFRWPVHQVFVAHLHTILLKLAPVFSSPADNPFPIESGRKEASLPIPWKRPAPATLIK